MNNPPDTAVLACASVAKTFQDGILRVDVLKNVDLQIYPGERVAIIGASGSGKSTLLHLLGGLDKPSTGEVWVQGKSIAHLSEIQLSQLRNQTLGFIYQFHHLLPEFTVLENVCIPLLLRNMAPKCAKEKALSILEKVGLSHRDKHKLGELSGGERQRTAIARALVTDPVCVLADEPTGNLDHQNADRIYDLMLTLNQTLKTSFLIVTHDLRLTKHMHRTFELVDGYLQPHLMANT
jgi:lipoprotein-releasing system ATP-binding protein